MKELNVVIFIGEKKLNAIMESFDLKGSFKIFGKKESLTITLKDDADEEKVLNYMLEKLKEQYVVAALIAGNRTVFFKDENIKALSDGKRIFSLDDLINSCLV